MNKIIYHSIAVTGLVALCCNSYGTEIEPNRVTTESTIVLPDNGGINNEGWASTLPRLHFELHRTEMPEDNGVACQDTGNGTASIANLLVGQTQLMPPDWPLFFTITDRAAMVRTEIAGTGAAPDVRVSMEQKGMELGHLCARGPDTLPGTYDIVIPREWMQPDATLVVRAGDKERRVSPTEMKMRPDVVYSLMTIEVSAAGVEPQSTFQDQVNDEDVFQNLAHTWPGAAVNHAHFPLMPTFPKEQGLWLEDVTSEGRELWQLDCAPHQEDCDISAGFAFPAAGRKLGSAIAIANGLSKGNDAHVSTYLSVPFEGVGRGASQSASGYGWGHMVQHEGGHAQGLQHVGNYHHDFYPYPYGRAGPHDALIAGWEVLPAQCVIEDERTGETSLQWRADPLSWGNAVCHKLNGELPKYAPFSDYHALRILRKWTGDTEETGWVAFNGELGQYGFNTTEPDVQWRDPSTFERERWNRDTAKWESVAPRIRYLEPIGSDSPVYTLVAAVSNHIPVGSSEPILEAYQPIGPYLGFEMETIDWIDPPSVARLQGERQLSDTNVCSRHCDIIFMVKWSDGTKNLYSKPESEFSDQLQYLAINVPAEENRTIVSWSVGTIPLSNKASGNKTEGNINYPGFDLMRYLRGAQKGKPWFAR